MRFIFQNVWTEGTVFIHKAVTQKTFVNIEVREREREICAGEKLLLVKILFEEVSFQASFEGREGRAVKESARKRV